MHVIMAISVRVENMFVGKLGVILLDEGIMSLMSIINNTLLYSLIVCTIMLKISNILSVSMFYVYSI
jgi:hypothetical protein